MIDMNFPIWKYIMTDLALALVGAIRDAIRLTEDATHEIVTLAALGNDPAMAAALFEICRHQRINIVKMQCQIAELCAVMPGEPHTHRVI
jgi:hypothetical protein